MKKDKKFNASNFFYFFFPLFNINFVTEKSKRGECKCSKLPDVQSSFKTIPSCISNSPYDLLHILSIMGK